MNDSNIEHAIPLAEIYLTVRMQEFKTALESYNETSGIEAIENRGDDLLEALYHFDRSDTTTPKSRIKIVQELKKILINDRAFLKSLRLREMRGTTLLIGLRDYVEYQKIGEDWHMTQKKNENLNAQLVEMEGLKKFRHTNDEQREYGSNGGKMKKEEGYKKLKDYIDRVGFPLADYKDSSREQLKIAFDAFNIKNGRDEYEITDKTLIVYRDMYLSGK